VRLLAAAVAIGLAATVAPAGARERGADGVFEERTSSHFRLLQDVDLDRASGPSGSRRFEIEVLELLEEGFDRVDELLGLRPARRLTVTVYDPQIFDTTYARLVRFPMAGFYRGQILVRGDVQVTPQLARTLYHELVHAAFDAEAPSLVLPAWLNEGVAEWFEARAYGKRRLTPREWAALQQVADAGQLPALGLLAAPSFSRLDAPSAQLAYLYSYGFVDHLARTHGERDLRRLCQDVVRSGNLARAFRRVYRASPDELAEGFAAEFR
jgi:hypothetical protein